MKIQWAPSDRLIPLLLELSRKAIASTRVFRVKSMADTALLITEESPPCPAVSYNIAWLVNFCELRAWDIAMITLKLNPL